MLEWIKNVILSFWFIPTSNFFSFYKNELLFFVYYIWQILKSCRPAQSLKLGGVISTESMTSLEMILSFTINKERNSDRKTHLICTGRIKKLYTIFPWNRFHEKFRENDFTKNSLYISSDVPYPNKFQLMKLWVFSITNRKLTVLE